MILYGHYFGDFVQIEVNVNYYSTVIQEVSALNLQL